MIEIWVELSGENPDLARAEAVGAAQAMGLRLMESRPLPLPSSVIAFAAEDPADATGLAERLALSRRCLAPWSESGRKALEHRLKELGARGRPAAFRGFGHLMGPTQAETLRSLADAYKSGGGTIDLVNPELRLWVYSGRNGDLGIAEELATVDRPSFALRRMPRLPFQRPVSLPPRLARAAANLAQIRPGDRVADPFVGTGALLVEVGLLGGRLVGVDINDAMVRGTLRNLTHLHLEAEELVVGDSEEVGRRKEGKSLDAIVTDPPYGRASSSGGETTEHLLKRVLPVWADRVVEIGRIVVIVPGGPDPLPPPWERTLSVQSRVHRSLTREFRVYERRPRG